MKIVGYCGDWNAEAVVRMVMYAARICDQFLLVVAKHREGEAMAILHNLMPYLITSKSVSAWPGTTKLDGETRKMLKFSTNQDAMSTLLDDILPVLFMDDPPFEDLAMLRSNGSPYVVTITHERDMFFKLKPKEINALVLAVGAEAVQIQGDDEVPDETY